MRTVIFTFTLIFSLLGHLLDSDGVVKRIVDALNQMFSWLGFNKEMIPDLTVNTIWKLVGIAFTVSSSLLFITIRYFRILPPTWFRFIPAGRADLRAERDEAPGEGEKKEKEYLSWLSLYMKSRNQEWKQQRNTDIQIIPTPAHPRKQVPPPSEPAPAEKAELFRYDTNDYLRNLSLKHAELATRASFGNRTKIKDLAKELRRHKKIVVLGDPGSGKSVCLRQLAYDICQAGINRNGRPRTIPIYVEMKTYDSWEDESAGMPTSPLNFLMSSLTNPLEHPSLSDDSEHPLLYISDQLQQLLKAGRVTLIFDALDEMPQDSYEERYNILKRFTEKWEVNQGNRFVFSCRLLDYDPVFEVSEVIIDPFDKKKIQHYLQKNAPSIADTLYQSIEDNKALEELVSNPFFLQALTYINLSREEADKLRLPPSRGELIAEFAEEMLVNEVEKQKEVLGRIDGGMPTLRAFLSEVGFALQKRRSGRTSAPTESLVDIWDKYSQWKELLWAAQRAHILGERGAIPDRLLVAKVLSQNLAESGGTPDPFLAVKTPLKLEPPQRIEFKHHRLQEYFAAEALARRLAAGEAVDDYLEDIWWQETVVFSIGIVKDSRPIIGRMLSQRDDTNEWIEDVLKQAEDPLAED